jgi:hypothetical protein
MREKGGSGGRGDNTALGVRTFCGEEEKGQRVRPPAYCEVLFALLERSRAEMSMPAILTTWK